MPEYPFELTNRLAWPLRGDVHLPDSAPRAPVIVICHGFKGFKDWGHFPTVARRLAEAGFRVVRFNFGGAGIGEIADQFTELDRFRENTLSLEIDDLGRMLDALARGELPGISERGASVGLLGHSRGALVSTVIASRRSEVKALVSWAGVGVLDQRYPADVRVAWRRAGFLPITNARTGQEMPIGIAALDDIEAHLESYSPDRIAPKLAIPLLLVHGDADPTVPVAEAEAVHAACDRRSVLEIIAGGDHVFGSSQPFRGVSPELERAINRTVAFFREVG